MIEKSLFGITKSGEKVYKFDLISGSSVASILTFGATIQSLIVPSNHGMLDVVMGYSNLSSYEEFDGYLGATVGRNGNRIKNGEFYLDDTLIKLNKNDGDNNLHGGNIGFSHKVWSVKSINVEENSITLSYLSKDGEENFPGNLQVETKFTLNGSSLVIEYFAITDKKTVCNLTNHSYFCLDGAGEPSSHDAFVKIDADRVLEVDEGLIPTGNFINVENTPFDFRDFKQIKTDILSNDKQIEFMHGYDCNFCLNANGKHKEVAWLYSKRSGVKLTVKTSNYGLQLYTGYFLTDRVGKGGKTYKQNTSICLETQTYPDAVNNKNFPSSILSPTDKYYVKTEYLFSLKKD